MTLDLDKDSERELALLEEVPQEDFVLDDERYSSRDDYLSRDFIATDSGPIPTSIDTPGSAEDFPRFEEFLSRRISMCRDIVADYSRAKSSYDLRARQHLVQIAQIVHHPEFCLEKVGERFCKKISATMRRNPYSFLIQMTDPQRDSKVVSKQSLALTYAIRKCEMDVGKLLTYFETESIKGCYQGYKNQRRLEREDKPLKPVTKRLVLEGAPPDLAGEVTIRIRVLNGIASYVALIELEGHYVDQVGRA